MKRLIIAVTGCILIMGYSINAGAQQAKKYVMAVPYFELEGEVSGPYGKTLSDTLLSSLEKTGRFLTKSEDDINQILKTMAKKQAIVTQDCSDDACMRRLGEKMQVDYIISSRISRVSGKFFLSVRLINILSELEIPTITRKNLEEEELLQAVERIAQEIALRFPLEGVITAVNEEDESVIINMGASHSIKVDDELFIEKEKGVKNSKGKVEFSDRKRIGKIKIVTVQPNKSKGEIEKGSGFAEGDFAVIDQEKLLERFKEEEAEEMKKLANKDKLAEKKKEKEKEEAEDRESDKEWAARESRFNSRAPILRVAYGAVSLNDSELDKLYGSGNAFMGDIFLSRGRDRNGDGFDTFFRYTYRSFAMPDDITTQPDGIAYGIVSPGEMTMHSFDYSMRYVVGAYFLWERWDIYILGGFRMQYTEVSAKNGLSDEYWSMGLVGGGGLEVTIFNGVGIFGEYNIGKTPVGDRNIEGHQVYAGVTLRSAH